jgi:excisionase family DNA binding protein
MHIERTQTYRVKAVAAGLDVSPSTIYRAVESGELRAERLGRGKGTIRIPGDALIDYKAACARAAVRAAHAEKIGGAA